MQSSNSFRSPAAVAGPDRAAAKQAASKGRVLNKRGSNRMSRSFRDYNKRPAIPCKFFAEGRCLRGTKCRFLHITNSADNTSHIVGENVALKSDIQGSDSNSRPDLPCDFFAKGWCIMGNKCRFLHHRTNHVDDTSHMQGDEGSDSDSSPPGFGGSDWRNASSSSMMQNFSPFSGPGMERSCHNSAYVLYNSEPNVPFQPSFSIPSVATSSPRSQYDLPHDSTKQNEEIMASNIEPKEENSPGGSVDALIGSQSGAATDPNHQTDLSGQRREKSWLEEMHRSRAAKPFRHALTVFIRELADPLFLENYVTKDVFKTIVRKSMKKVIDSVKTNELPKTKEQIDRYLSTYRPKIVKLIEGYAENYGVHWSG